ncbi:MAG: flagellar hook-length control protein FliK [Pseudomonas sp.]|nr:flagellar hook-length control protein FliK [Pseudomonas sp.]
MSGITPLLDTLLHQVLGRRVDIPLAKDLNQPAGPVVPVQGMQPLRSDSRLDPRGLPQAQEAGRAQQASAAQASQPRSGLAGTPAMAAPVDAASSSTITSFSSAARAIADLLQRFPAPASAIGPATPLLAGAPGEAPAAALIAARLQQSIQHSGLFYESHVARWFRGELPLEALRHEPQMRVPLQAAPRGSEPPVPAPLPAGSSTSPVGQQSASAPALPPGEAARAAVPAGNGDEMPGAEALEGGQESVASVLRQQLELLAVPQLRWEGNVWAGVFMGLVIEAPALAEPELDEEGETAEREAATGGEWKVRLGLQLAGHGALEAAISLQGERLALTLQTDSASLRGYFEGSHGELEASLLACGFSSVRLQLLDAVVKEAEDGRG